MSKYQNNIKIKPANSNHKKTLGFIETRGKTCIIYAVDEMLKGTNVTLEGYKRSGSAYIAVAFSGKTDDIINAINIGTKSVETIEKHNPSPQTYQDGLCQLITTHTISRSSIDIINIFFNKRPGISYPEAGNAIGFVDARGLVSLIAAADVMTKLAPIEVLGYHRMGSGRLDLAVAGTVDAVSQAIEKGIEIVQKHGKLIGYNVIPRPHQGLKEMLK